MVTSWVHPLLLHLVTTEAVLALTVHWDAKADANASKSSSSDTAPGDIRDWLKCFKCSHSDMYTHSSLFGSKDWTTE